jgi:hypothetical protein
VQPTSLSPRALLEILAPALRLDDELVEGWTLADCYRLDEREPVCLELRRAGERVELEVEPEVGEGEAPKPAAGAAGLRLGYRVTAAREAAVAACRALAELLEAQLGAAARSWVVEPPSLAHLAEAVAAEVRCEPASLVGDPDRALLLRDFDAYERLYGVRPGVFVVHVQGEAVPGVSVHYPAARNGRVPNSAAVYPAARRVAHRRRMRRYFGHLGCSFDVQGCPRTVPTPTTYARALAGRGGLARVRPKMIAGVSASLRPVHWGVLVRRSLLPVSVAPPWSVEIHRRIRDVELLANIPCDVGMLVHDMGLHALALHAVPAEAWDELLRRAFERVRARPWSVLAGPFGLLARLASFFEGPVTTHCWKAWQEADEPEDFERCFAPHFDALRDELREL